MTDKKRRQRGSRTHGGGTHKNRRGAGNRGGRGNAGRSTHEFHNHGPLGKHGFTRPEKATDEVREVDLQRLDEDVALLAAEGLAEETADGYRIDARDVAPDGHEVDVVKVLGAGQLHASLEVVADAFSASAAALLAETGGEAILSERGAARQAAAAESGEGDTTDEAEGDA